MNIAIDVSQIVYQGTGVGRYVYNLTKGLLKLKTPHQFTLYAGALQRKEELLSLSRTKPFSKAAWKILPIPPKAAGWLYNQTALPIEALIGRHDLFHSSDWSEPKTSMAHVTTVHDLAFRFFPETVDPLILKTHSKRLERVVKHQTHIIADSLSTKNDLVKEYHLPKSLISVVYPGIGEQFGIKSQREIARVKKKYGIIGKYILTVGTREPRKNLVRAVAAFTKFRDTPEGKGCSLVITGRKGWGKDTDHTPHTISTGYVDERDLPGLYAGAEVFLYPSLYEGFGFPVVEAMACGTPVVTSNTSSLPEVAGTAGILVNPISVDGITAGLVKTINNRESLIKKGLVQAAKFNWRETAEQVMEVYEEIARA